jgi:hypothetical protein
MEYRRGRRPLIDLGLRRRLVCEDFFRASQIDLFAESLAEESEQGIVAGV